MTNIAVVTGLTFFLICIVLVAWHSLRLGRLTLLDWAILGMGGVYGAGGALVAYVTKRGGNPFGRSGCFPGTICILCIPSAQ